MYYTSSSGIISFLCDSCNLGCLDFISTVNICTVLSPYLGNNIKNAYTNIIICCRIFGKQINQHHPSLLCADIRITFVSIKTLTPKQNGCHVEDELFKCTFSNEKKRVFIQISFFVSDGPIGMGCLL